jgi:Zn finger protein HypA/HybF involved in hydrogenase expression/uncharacterized membrane protein (Fun14 family)
MPAPAPSNAVPTAAFPRPLPTDLVPEDARCHTCNYSLQGLTYAACCPECATPNHDSAQRQFPWAFVDGQLAADLSCGCCGSLIPKVSAAAACPTCDVPLDTAITTSLLASSDAAWLDELEESLTFVAWGLALQSASLLAPLVSVVVLLFFGLAGGMPVQDALKLILALWCLAVLVGFILQQIGMLRVAKPDPLLPAASPLNTALATVRIWTIWGSLIAPLVLAGGLLYLVVAFPPTLERSDFDFAANALALLIAVLVAHAVLCFPRAVAWVQALVCIARRVSSPASAKLLVRLYRAELLIPVLGFVWHLPLIFSLLAQVRLAKAAAPRAANARA